MNTKCKNRPEHDEVEQYSAVEATQEPSSGDFNILLSIPESIEIKMVDATALSDYEIWLTCSSLIFSLFVGFLVAYIQESSGQKEKLLAITALIFVCIFIFCLVMTIYKRHLLKKRGKTIKLKTSKIAEEKLD